MINFLINEKDIERFLKKVNKTNYCWLWTASKHKNGYGQFAVRKPNGLSTMALAHRVSFLIHTLYLPDLQLDHLCKIRHCVNPEHLEPVTNFENTMRTDHWLPKQINTRFCPKNHEYTDQNTYRAPGSPTHRKCVICMHENTNRWNEKNRLEKNNRAIL